ncbi:helix-turn-helix domain-containing protein [Streptomyces sp. NPDC048251]|uniref:helix-turn-helix domain-containing protein n=1 Tax=Streptomyces sp. NPDC048251 TaxID=3154501 RepID=UPI00342D2755
MSAAKAEFSLRGMAGARMDRIARGAGTSKEHVYAYFSSKVTLYRFVSAQELAAVAKRPARTPPTCPVTPAASMTASPTTPNASDS